MINQKQTAIAESFSKAIQGINMVAFNAIVDSEKDDPTLPGFTINDVLIKFLCDCIRTYRSDIDGIYNLYRNAPIWRASIRLHFNMDDSDEAGYWYYHAFKTSPNRLFELYMEEHPTIAFEKILEMFEYGWRNEYLKLKLQPSKVLSTEMFEHAIKEMFFMINDRLPIEKLVHPKETAQFISYLNTLSHKIVEPYILVWEANEVKASFAALCRETMWEDNPAQQQLALTG